MLPGKPGLCSLSYRDEWMFAAQDQEDVFLIQGGDALEKLKKCEEAVHQNGPAVIGMRVPAARPKCLRLPGQYIHVMGAMALCQ